MWVFSPCLSFIRTLVGFRANPLAKTPFPNKIKRNSWVPEETDNIFLVAMIQHTPSSNKAFLQLILLGYHLLVVHHAFFPFSVHMVVTRLLLLFSWNSLILSCLLCGVPACSRWKKLSHPWKPSCCSWWASLASWGSSFPLLWDYLFPDTMWDWRLELVFLLPPIPYSAKNASRDSGNICEW